MSDMIIIRIMVIITITKIVIVIITIKKKITVSGQKQFSVFSKVARSNTAVRLRWRFLMPRGFSRHLSTRVQLAEALSLPYYVSAMGYQKPVAR